MEQKVNIISLGVADVAASTAFYERLGWRRSAVSNPSITFFQAGAIVVGLYGRDALTAETGLDAPPGGSAGQGFGGITLAYNIDSREAVDAVLAEAQAAGGRITAPAQDRHWGGYSGYFADPDNHVWEVAWNPNFEVQPDGSVRLPG